MQRARILPKSGKPAISREIQQYKVEQIPTSSALPLKEETPLLFQIDAQPGHYIDLSMLKLSLLFRVTNEDGSSLKADEPPVLAKSAPLYTFFRNLKVFWNQTAVYNGNFLYPWYANYILAMKMPSAQMNILYQTVLYEKDCADLQPAYRGGKLKSYDGEFSVPNWEVRNAKYSESKQVEVIGPILHDLQFQSKLLRDDISIRLELTMGKTQCSLFAASLKPKYAIQIERAICFVPRAQINEKFLPVQRSLESSYYFVQHDLQMHVIPKGTVNYMKQVISGAVPWRFLFFLVNEIAYNGDYVKSPFNFRHYNVKFVQLRIAGGCSFPLEPLTPDFENQKYAESYMALYENMRHSLGGGALPFNLQQFANGNYICALDLTRDFSCGAPHWSEIGSGIASLYLQFTEPLQENVIMICLHELERICNVDPQGRVDIQDAPLY